MDRKEIEKSAYREIGSYRRSIDYQRACHDLSECVLEEFEVRTHVTKRRTSINLKEQKNKRLIKTYGISLDQYNQMIVDQEGLCAICGEKMIKPNIDHDHKTGRVRGLLCRRCNTGLGVFKDSVKFLESAARYLR